MQMVIGGCDTVPSPSSDDTVKNLGGYAVDRQQQQEGHGGGWGEQPWRKGVEWQRSKERWAAWRMWRWAAAATNHFRRPCSCPH